MKNFEAKKFGAFVAHILNTANDNEAVVTIHAQYVDGQTCSFEQFIKWFLSSNRKYLVHLIGLNEMNLAMPPTGVPRPSLSRAVAHDLAFDDAQRGVDLWFEHVFDRVLFLTKSEPIHNGHKLLLRLIERCPTVADLNLHRQKSAPADTAGPFHFSMRRLKQQLERAGEPQLTANARKTNGPLILAMGSVLQEVPDGLSLAAAINCAPERMQQLELDDELALIAFLQEATNTANRHWLFLRSLGLSPPNFMSVEDWEDAPFSSLTMNQAQTASKWINLAKSMASDDGIPEPSANHYEQAWLRIPVSKKMSFADFEITKAGRALMSTDKLRKVSYDQLTEQGLDFEDNWDPGVDEIASHEETVSGLNEIEKTGVLDDVTMLMLRRLTAGDDLADIHANHPEVRLRFRSLNDLYEHSDILAEEIQNLVQTSDGTEN